MSVTQQQAIDLAKDRDDVDLQQAIRVYGVLALSCAWEGIAATDGLKTTDFSRRNPWIHFAIRDGVVAAVKEDISHLREHEGNKVFTSHDESGEQMTIERTVFKGE